MTRKEILVVSVLSCVLALPFLNKPFHIDDTVVLHVTKRVIEKPGDPLGGIIDWLGHEDGVWKVTTNPPLVSYYLAPFAWLSGFSEVVLHLAILPFYWLFGFSAFTLARRFTRDPWLPFLFLATSSAVLVSGNVMRDIPAAGLATAGLAGLVYGSDRSDWRLSSLGGLLMGLSILAKYPLAMLTLPIGLYFVFRRRTRHVGWLMIPAAIVLLWCQFTAMRYGMAHPLYLLLEKSSNSNILWQDKFFGAVLIHGSVLYLAPALLWIAFRRRQFGWMAGSLVVAIGLVIWGIGFYNRPFDFEFSVWLVLGGIMSSIALAGAGELKSPDSILLLSWFAIPLFFSVFFIPFQAVRHQLPVLVPLVLLAFRYIDNTPEIKGFRKSLFALLVIQLGVALLVHSADYEYAAVYRDFAVRTSARTDEWGGRIWYAGHWGWKYYADQAGFRQLHRDGPFPVDGDILIWPDKVHKGDAFSKLRRIRDRLQLLETVTYQGALPLRTMSVGVRAGFYAVARQRIPYRFSSSEPLEEFRVYQVRSNVSVR
jgi:hypothetical protein